MHTLCIFSQCRKTNFQALLEVNKLEASTYITEHPLYRGPEGAHGAVERFHLWGKPDISEGCLKV